MLASVEISINALSQHLLVLSQTGVAMLSMCALSDLVFEKCCGDLGKVDLVTCRITTDSALLEYLYRK